MHNTDQDTLDALDPHTWAAMQLTDFVNGHLPPDDAQRMQAHLDACPACRRDLALEHAVAQRLRQQPTVEYAPQASWRRLQTRIADEGPARAPRRARLAWPPTWPSTGRGWAGVVASLIMVAGVTAALWMQAPQPGVTGAGTLPAAAYRTFSQPELGVPHLQVVFAETATAADMRAALARVRGRIASGPAINGLFLVTVQAPGELLTAADLDAAAETLNADPAVRFAAAHPGDKP